MFRLIEDAMFRLQVRDPSQEPCGRLTFLKEGRTIKGLPQTAVCNLNITLPAVKKVRQSQLTIFCVTSINILMVRVVWAPITLIDERLRPNCRHCVFYLFSASLFIKPVIFAVDSRHWLFCFVPFYHLLWHASGWGLFEYQAGVLWLDSFAVFASECRRFAFFCCRVFFFFFLLLCLLSFALSASLPKASVDHSFFTPWCFFSPPCFPLCYSPCFCNASWEPGNGVRCRGWGKSHPPHHVLSSALDLRRPCLPALLSPS